MSRQKNKGSKWEREVSAVFTDVFELDFNRTLSSGAFVGGKNAHRKSNISKSLLNASLGDVVTPDSWSFVIECKSYADINFNGIIQGYCARLSGWIDEVRFDTEHADNHMVIFKINRAGAYMVLPENKHFTDKLIEHQIPFTFYPHSFYKDEEETIEETRDYIILDWSIMLGAYEEPVVLNTVKDYILHLAEIKEK